jgi:uncharacterized protein
MNNQKIIIMIHVEKPSVEKLRKLDVKSWPVWEKEISEFQWEYDESETCYIIEGKVIVTPENGNSVTFGKGDLVVFSSGLKCKWKIISAVRKYFKFG